MIGDLADVGIGIHFATESLDFNSRGGRLAADIQAVVAADYIRNLREEAKKGLEMRLQQGLYPFKAPLGYLDHGKGNPKTICPSKGPLVRVMFELYASGQYSLWSLPDEMNRRGLTSSTGGKIYKTSVEKILKNPFYTGTIRIARTGKTYQGIHEPLITQSLFDAVQAERANRNNHKSTAHNHMFRGIVKCANCDHSLIGERQKQFIYYRCHSKTCPSTSIREDRLAAYFEGQLEQAVLPQEALTFLREELDAFFEETNAATRTAEADFEISKIESRLDKLLDCRLDGEINQDVYERKKSILVDGQSRWREIKQSAEQLGASKEFMLAFVKWSQKLPILFKLAAETEKRALLKLATSNCTMRGKNVVFTPSNWLFALQNIGDVSFGAHDKSKARTWAADFYSTVLRKIEELDDHTEGAIQR